MSSSQQKEQRHHAERLAFRNASPELVASRASLNELRPAAVIVGAVFLLTPSVSIPNVEPATVFGVAKISGGDCTGTKVVGEEAVVVVEKEA